MELKWIVTEGDTKRLKAFVKERSDDAFVRNRLEKNLLGQRAVPSVAEFWKAMIACLLTTQQRSGPESAVATFLGKDPFPLEFECVRDSANARTLIRNALSDHGGLRFCEKISHQAEENLNLIIQEWDVTIEHSLQAICSGDSVEVERKVAQEFQIMFKGFGPKQARNHLQTLGLSRHEIPLDSRIIKWVNGFGFPIRLSSAGLSDENYYCFVMDGIQSLCAAAGILPCIFDAVVFSSYDERGWEDVPAVF